jgi:voltage-gated potassium channel Kch
MQRARTRRAAILICIDKPETATRIAEICKAEYPLVPVLARA